MRGIELPTREWDGNGSLPAFVLSNNLHRRHLTATQRATTAVKFLPHLEHEAKQQQCEALVRGNKNRGDAAPIPASLPESAQHEVDQPTKPTVRADREARGMAAKLTGASPRYVSDVKQLRAKGLSTRAIAEQVGVSHFTVQQDIKSGGRFLPPDANDPEPEPCATSTTPSAPSAKPSTARRGDTVPT